MKLCQEVVCLDEIIAWNKIHIDYSKSYVSILVKVSPTLQGFQRLYIKGFLSYGGASARGERSEPRDRKGVQREKLATDVEGLLLIDAIDLSQHVFQ